MLPIYVKFRKDLTSCDSNIRELITVVTVEAKTGMYKRNEKH